MTQPQSNSSVSKKVIGRADSEERSPVGPEQRSTMEPNLTTSTEHARHLNSAGKIIDGAAAKTVLRFGGWLQTLKISDAQRRQIEALLKAESKNIETFDILSAAVPKDPTAVAGLQRSIANSLDDKLSQLIAPDQIEAFNRILNTKSISDAVAGIAAATYFNGGPITSEQGSDIFRILQESARPSAGGSPRIDILNVDWSIALPKLSLILSSSQMDTTKAFFARYRYAAQYRQLTGFPASSHVPGI